MTAFAAKNTGWSNDDLWSPNYLKSMGPTTNDPENRGWAVDADGNRTSAYIMSRDANGHRVDVTWRELAEGTLESINEEGKVAEIFKKNGYKVSDNTDFIPLLNGDITFIDGVPEGGGQITFQLADLGVMSQGYKPGDTIYLMQQTAPNSQSWDVYAATIGPNGDVTFTVPRNGALVLVKTLADGSVVALDKTTGEVINRVPADNVANNNAGTSTSTNASGATSPKTGEF